MDVYSWLSWSFDIVKNTPIKPAPVDGSGNVAPSRSYLTHVLDYGASSFGP